MHIFLKKYQTEFILILILLAATLMRFINISSMSLFNDELSAMARLQFQSFSELIQKGVKFGDGHPAGVQVFLYYWTMLFGASVFAFRLPFVLAGVGSVFLIYQVGKKWFNQYTGLFAAASLAFLEYIILYNQLARPYSLGLFFTLLHALYWKKFFIDKKTNYKIIIVYVFTAVACLYIHYFSMLMVLVMGITGLFFINRKTWIPLLIIVAGSFILYFPHLDVFIEQFRIGGVGGWLQKPTTGWLFEYLFYCFNNSVLVLVFVILIFLISLFVYLKNRTKNRLRIISLTWFLTIFLTGFLYSVFVNPVLQYSVLIFAFPFFILFVFSYIDTFSKKIIVPVLALYSLILIYSTVFEKEYYSTEHFAEFKAIAEKISEIDNKYGKENITHTININRPFYIKYYMPNGTDSIHFEQYRNDGRDDLLKIKLLAESSQTKYFLTSWSNIYNSPVINEIIREYYPYCILREKHFNSEVCLFSKNKSDSIVQNEIPVITYIQDFDTFANWNLSEKNIDTAIAYVGKKSYRFDNELEWGPTLDLQYSQLKDKNPNKIIISCYFKNTDLASDSILQVVSIKSGETTIDWLAISFNYFVTKQSDWNKIIFVYEFPENYELKDNDLIQIYIWNQAKRKFNIDEIKIDFYHSSSSTS